MAARTLVILVLVLQVTWSTQLQTSLSIGNKSGDDRSGSQTKIGKLGLSGGRLAAEIGNGITTGIAVGSGLGGKSGSGLGGGVGVEIGSGIGGGSGGGVEIGSGIGVGSEGIIKGEVGGGIGVGSGGKVEGGIGGEIGSGIGIGTGGKIEGGIGGEIGSGVGVGIGSGVEIGRGLEVGIGSGFGGKIGNGIGVEIGRELGGGIGIKSNLGGKIGGKIGGGTSGGIGSAGQSGNSGAAGLQGNVNLNLGRILGLNDEFSVERSASVNGASGSVSGGTGGDASLAEQDGITADGNLEMGLSRELGLGGELKIGGGGSGEGGVSNGVDNDLTLQNVVSLVASLQDAGLKGELDLGGVEGGVSTGQSIDLGSLASLKSDLGASSGSLDVSASGLGGSEGAGIKVNVGALPITSHLMNGAAKIGSNPLHALLLSRLSGSLGNMGSSKTSGGSLSVNVPSPLLKLRQLIPKFSAKVSGNSGLSGVGLFGSGQLGGKGGLSGSTSLGPGISVSAGLGSETGISASAGLGSGAGISGSTGLGSAGISGSAGLGSAGISGSAGLGSAGISGSVGVGGRPLGGTVKGGGLRLIETSGGLGAGRSIKAILPSIKVTSGSQLSQNSARR